MRFSRCLSALALLAGTVTPALGVSADLLDGVRVGARLGTSASEKAESFTQEELFAQMPLPWKWQFSDWTLATKVNFTVGRLDGGGTSAVFGHIGPSINLSRSWFFAEIGLSPTVLEKHRFGRANFGGDFQFTSAATVGVQFGPKRSFTAAYRIQHMSNAGIENTNPGLELHMLELGYRF